jgi:hypothetical protein
MFVHTEWLSHPRHSTSRTDANTSGGSDFGPLKQHFEDRRFHSEEVAMTIRECLPMQQPHFYQDGSFELVQEGIDISVLGIMMRNNYNSVGQMAYVLSCNDLIIFVTYGTLFNAHKDRTIHGDPSYGSFCSLW